MRAGEPYEEEQRAISSMVAVCLAVLHGQVRQFSRRDPVGATYKRTATKLRPHLDQLDSAKIAEFAEDLTQSFGPALEPEAVETLAAEIRNPTDLLDTAVRLFAEERDMPASRDRQTIGLEKKLPAVARHLLLAALGVAQEADPVAVIAEREGKGPTLAAWVPPTLLLVQQGAAGTLGDVYTLTGAMKPSVYAEGKETSLPRPDVSWMARQRVPAAAREVLEAVGLDPDEPFDS